MPQSRAPGRGFSAGSVALRTQEGPERRASRPLMSRALARRRQFSASSVTSCVQAPSGSLVIAGFSAETEESSVFTVCS